MSVIVIRWTRGNKKRLYPQFYAQMTGQCPEPTPPIIDGGEKGTKPDPTTGECVPDVPAPVTTCEDGTMPDEMTGQCPEPTLPPPITDGCEEGTILNETTNECVPLDPLFQE